MNKPNGKNPESEGKPELGVDQLLQLRGLGKEVWAQLGGGENFIREMRKTWSGDRIDPMARRPKKRRRLLEA